MFLKAGVCSHRGNLTAMRSRAVFDVHGAFERAIRGAHSTASAAALRLLAAEAPGGGPSALAQLKTLQQVRHGRRSRDCEPRDCEKGIGVESNRRVRICCWLNELASQHHNPCASASVLAVVADAAA